jgi:hypothetical protein
VKAKITVAILVATFAVVASLLSEGRFIVAWLTAAIGFAASGIVARGDSNK